MRAIALLAVLMPACGWDWQRFEPPASGLPGGAARWELTFQEECDGPLDDAKWRTTYWRGGEFHHYGWAQSAVASTNVTFEDGLCNIRLENRATRGLPYTAGVLDTGGKWEQRYGYFEIRARTARGAGLRTNLQLSHPDSWPPLIEIGQEGDDVGDARFLVTYRDGDPKYANVDLRAADFTQELHTFGVLWSETEIAVYLDGVRVGAVAAEVPRFMDSALKFELTGHVGAHDEPPDATTPWPGVISIDFVRAYRAR